MAETVAAKAVRMTRYADYVQRCNEHGITPVSFRLFVETDDEYECEWEVANYEYDHEGDTNERAKE